MGKILISEDQLEILTGHVLFNEQEEELKKDRQSDEERLGFKTSVESGEYETYEGGKPYELFLAKTDIKSKAYFQSGDFTESESKSLYYKYRRPNPISIQIKELMEVRNKWVKAQISYFDDKGGEEAAFVWWAEKAAPKMGAKLKKLQERLKELLPRKNITKEFQYTSNKPDNFKKGGWEKNPDYNEDGAKEDKKIAQVKKKVGDVTFSPADRLEVMYQIVQFVKKQYDGDYDAAASDKVWKRKGSKLIGSGWVKRGIETIVLRPENIKTKEIIPEVIEQNNVGTLVDIQPSDADGQLFLNNLWAPSDFFKKQLDEMVENIIINRDNVSSKFGGADVKMTIATEICSGGGDEDIDCSKKIPYPYRIDSSCSQVPNCVDDEGMRLKSCGEGKDKTNPSHKLVDGGSTKPAITFEQLSKNRANTAKTLIAEKLGEIGVTMTEPVINWKGENSDVPGTSGPAYKQGGPVESEAYKLARYVKIKLAIQYEVADIAIPEPPEPETYKVGDFRVTLQSDYDSWDPWWSIPPIKWPKWKPFKKKFKNKRRPKKFKTIECPNFLKKGPSGSEGMWSDISLKENINLVGKSNSGINIYEFDYIDKKFGSGRYRGVMAQEVPHASLMSEEGYLMVDYSIVDVDFEEV